MKVNELLTERNKWTTGHAARNAKSKPVSVTSQQAVRWCLLGAIEKCYTNKDEQLAVINKTRSKIWEYGYNWVHTYNDASTFSQIKKLVKELDI